MALLAVEDVTRRFGGIVALADVSLALEPGEIGGLIGPNGAGKTTLFNLVTRLYKPNEGRIVLRRQGPDCARRRTASSGSASRARSRTSSSSRT